MINIYHKQAQRRKKNHLDLVQSLKTELENMKKLYNEMINRKNGRVEFGSPEEKLVHKIQEVSQKLDSEIEKMKKKDE